MSLSALNALMSWGIVNNLWFYYYYIVLCTELASSPDIASRVFAQLVGVAAAEWSAYKPLGTVLSVWNVLFLWCLQECAPGHYRSRSSPYLGICVKCSCNGHSDDCDVVTGECFVSRCDESVLTVWWNLSGSWFFHATGAIKACWQFAESLSCACVFVQLWLLSIMDIIDLIRFCRNGPFTCVVSEAESFCTLVLHALLNLKSDISLKSDQGFDCSILVISCASWKLI